MKRTIRALIVDDEPLARQVLAEMLGAHEDVELVGESANGTAAVRDIRRLRPDVVLLDVQLPGLDGFQVLRQLDAAEVPEIIFVTAYDQYALRAFDVHALDYLLKPFDEARLDAALGRARLHIEREDRLAHGHRIGELLEALGGRQRFVERLAVPTADRTLLLPVREIDWIEADGKFLRITAGAATHVVRERLYHLADRLDPQQFMRISRSAIINIDSVREIRPWQRGEYAVRMTDGTRLTSTRAYRDGLTRLIQEGSATGTV